MKRFVTRLVLAAAGGLLGVIGGALIISPRQFLEMSEVSVGRDPGLMSEIAAPGGLLLITGAFMILGAVRLRFANPSLLTGAIVYGSYGLGRLVSLSLHGLPSQSLIIAMFLELGMSGVLIALRRSTGSGTRREILSLTIEEVMG